MPVYRVKESQSLDIFLRSKGIPQYRISILLKQNKTKNKAVTLSRSGQRKYPTRGKTRLQESDLVGIPDTLPRRVQQELDKLPFRDYTLKLRDRGANAVLSKRPKTQPVDVDPRTVVGFFKALTGPAITNPIRHILLTSHADQEGHLFIALNWVSPRVVTYEDLVGLVKNKGRLGISRETFMPRPRDEKGNEIPATLFVRGCRIGRAPAALLALKAALGGHLLVNAPLHFHQTWCDLRLGVYIEHMGYGFELHETKPLSRIDAINAFRDREFKLYDGKTTVPRDKWTRWIPKKKWTQWTRPVGRRNRARSSPRPVSVKVLNSVTRMPITVQGQFRFMKRYLLTKPHFLELTADPRTKQKQMEAVKTDLVNASRWGGLYKKSDKLEQRFPMYERLGYKNMLQFLEGRDWQFKWLGGKLRFDPFRYEYTLLQPITKIGTKNTLLVNSYPSRRGGRTHIQLGEDDTQFFTTV